MAGSAETKQNQLVHIISAPRSGSTLLMRVMAKGLGDASIYSEPGVATFALKHDPNWVPHLGHIDPELQTFEGVEKRVTQDLKKGPVVVKDMIHTVNGFLKDGKSILTPSPDTRYVFLVRDPHAAEVSLSKFTGELPQWPPGLISYEMMYNLYAYLAEVTPHEPIVVDADRFFEEFPAELGILFNALGTSLASDSTQEFELDPLDTTTAIKKWHDPSNEKTFEQWHGRAAGAKKIHPLPQYEKKDGKPTFSEINPAFRDAYKAAYEENMIFYNLFLNLLTS